MKMKSQGLILTFLAIVFMHSSCHLDRCRYKLDDWHEHAPLALKEFKEVQLELAAQGYTKDSANLNLFIKSWDTVVYHVRPPFTFANKPELKQWMHNYPEGFISYRDGEIGVMFQNCQSYNEYTAYLYSTRPDRSSFKVGVEFVDSLALEDNWQYLVVRCRGCRD